MTANGLEVVYPEGYEVRPGGLIVRRVEEGIEWAVIDAVKLRVVAAVTTDLTTSAVLISGALSKMNKPTPDAL
jgi:hypothetical protein